MLKFVRREEGAMGESRFATFVDAALVAFGAIISAVSWAYGFGSLARPGPGLYPFFVGLAVCLSAFFTLISDARRGARAPLLDKSQVRTAGLMTMTFCFWLIAMPLLGYAIVTLLATYSFCKIMRLEGWRKPLGVSAGTAASIYVLFDYWLYIDLPRGPFG
jgi:putative tricarboxylic transport membrane protein